MQTLLLLLDGQDGCCKGRASRLLRKRSGGQQAIGRLYWPPLWRFQLRYMSGGRGTRTPTGLRPAVFKTAAIPLCEPSVKTEAQYTPTPYIQPIVRELWQKNLTKWRRKRLFSNQFLMQNIIPHLLLQPNKPRKTPVGGNKLGIGSKLHYLSL